MAEKADPIVQYCTHCQDTRAFTVSHQKAYQAEYEGLPEEVTLAFCRGCYYPALFGREIFGDPAQGEISDYYRIYPTEGRKVGYALPRMVKDAYEEAVRCERAKAWMATVTMVRRALEAIAKDYVTSGSTELFRALNKMHADGVISDEMKVWADGLRSWGNLGAHASQARITQDDARFALDFLQALMEIIYDLRPKFASWQASAKTPPKKVKLATIPKTGDI